ncbi:MAG: 50S ribosomal protein L18 [Bacteroidetes bacterium]|nr:MAG: 50S ribosomal protein L18 [Bacteroidota bacterium]
MTAIKELRRLKIRSKIRGKISGVSTKPRLAVFRSNTKIYAQLIDDANGVTLASSSTTDLKKVKGTKVEISKEVGKKIAEVAISKGISDVVFDRAGYLYHGRVKALAEGAREGGLKF